MLPNAIKQLRSRLIANIGQICPIEFGIGGQLIRKVEAERQFALKPGFHRMPVSGDDLRRRTGREPGNMLVGNLRHQRSGFGSCVLRLLGVSLENENRNSYQQYGRCGQPTQLPNSERASRYVSGPLVGLPCDRIPCMLQNSLT